jgi:hypothetical protein
MMSGDQSAAPAADAAVAQPGASEAETIWNEFDKGEVTPPDAGRTTDTPTDTKPADAANDSSREPEAGTQPAPKADPADDAPIAMA